MNDFIDTDTDPDTINCTAWAEPAKPLATLPRMQQDAMGLAVAARDIVKHEGVVFATALLRAHHIDPRMLPHLRTAIRKEFHRLETLPV